MTVINRFLSFAAVALAASVAFASGAFYQNDFSTRTSKRPVPRDEWFVKDYVAPCALFTSYDNTKSYTADLPYSNTDRTQDGWAKTHGNYDSNQLVNFYVRMPDAATNPFASFSNGSNRWGDQYETMAVQSLNNAFSSGRLRFSVDLKGPEKMSTKYDDGYFRFKALFQSLTSPSAEKYAPYALALGMDGGNAGSYGVLQTVGSDGKWDSPTTSGRQLVAAGKVDRAHWYRFVATLNLDESTYTCSVYDMGTTQPSLSTPMPDASDGYVTGSLYRRVADNGPICGFGLHTKYMTAYSATSKDDTTLNYATCANADNIRVWWKPTGSPTGFGDEDLVYENDFATRRYRMLQGTTSSTETASALAFPASDSFSYGATATNQVGQEAALNIVLSKGTVGCDGWKLADGETKIYVVDSTTAGGSVLAFTASGKNSRLGHSIGQSISSGKLKCECDFYTPSKWYGSSHTFTICLGGDSLMSDTAYAIRAGIGGQSDNETARYPYVYQDEPRLDTGTALEAKTWYRVSIVADFATKTFDYQLYKLPSDGGYDRADAELVAGSARTGVPFDANTPITTLAIYSYGSGTTFTSSHRADNIRIWTGTDGTSWDLVYRNNFSSRVRYGARPTREATLLDVDINRPGLDGWMRRGANNIADWVVREIDGDPCLAFEDERRIAHAQHLLPKRVTKGEMKFRVDIRPPTRCCSKMSKQTVRVFLGGDEYAQGEVGTTEGLREFDDAVFGYFGLSPSGTVSELGYDSEWSLCAKGADDIQKGYEISGDKRNNWYRFVATVDMDAKSWRVDVYNQGTTHPAVDAANGKRVQSFENLTFAYDDPSGISAFGLVAGATMGTQQTSADTKSLLVDNVVVEYERGVAIILR